MLGCPLVFRNLDTNTHSVELSSCYRCLLIECWVQELARAKARAAEQTGTLGAELGRLAPLRPVGQPLGGVHRLSGLQSGHRHAASNSGRESLVRGLALPPFARNGTLVGSQGGLDGPPTLSDQRFLAWLIELET